MATRGRPSGAAGRAPRAGRTGATSRSRSRAAPPSRKPAPAGVPTRPNLTARAAVLAVAIASVVLALALPFKVWVAQRGQIHAVESQTREQQQRIVDLREQQERWKDPDYVRQQARVRLHFALPNETTYVVLGKPENKKAKQKAAAEPALTGPWYSRLWQSVEAAGAAPASTQ
jgi:cell division protein FtsB